MPALARFLLPVLAVIPAACASHAPAATPQALRVATYNTSLYDEQAGGLVRRLEAGDPGARKIAAVLQQVRPDLVLLNEFDYDPDGRAADLFQHDYLEQPQAGGIVGEHAVLGAFSPEHVDVARPLRLVGLKPLSLLGELVLFGFEPADLIEQDVQLALNNGKLALER